MNMCDLVIHLDEDLEQGQLRELESVMEDRLGIFTACFSHAHPHLMTVAYDCDAMRSKDIVQQIQEQGWHAQAVGM